MIESSDQSRGLMKIHETDRKHQFTSENAFTVTQQHGGLREGSVGEAGAGAEKAGCEVGPVGASVLRLGRVYSCQRLQHPRGQHTKGGEHG